MKYIVLLILILFGTTAYTQINPDQIQYNPLSVTGDSIAILKATAGEYGHAIIGYDSSPTNEKDSLTITQVTDDSLLLIQVNGASYTLKFEVEGLVAGGSGGGSSTIDTFQLSGDILRISLDNDQEATKEVDLSTITSNADTEEQTGITTNTATATLTLSTGKYSIYLNGVLMNITGSRAHVQDVTVSGQGLTFYENLESSDKILIHVD